MPDYMDLEAWGCPDAHDNDGKACVEDLVTALAKEVQRPEAVQALLADEYAAEDMVRSPAWPSFCASISALLADPQPATAMAGTTLVERVLEEARLSDPQSVAELFIALASHLRPAPASNHRLPTADSHAKPAHLPAGTALPAVPRSESGVSSTQDEEARLCGPETYKPPQACAGSKLTTALIAVDCRAANGHVQGAATPKHGSMACISAASRSGVARSPERTLHPGGAPAERDAAAPRQPTCSPPQQNSMHGGGAAAQGRIAESLQQLEEARARQWRLLGRMLDALPRLWVCLRPPLMQRLWRCLSAVLLVQPQCGDVPAAGAAEAAHQQRNTQQPIKDPARLQRGRAVCAKDLQASALGSCLAGVQGPLVELSLAQEIPPLHAKSWWQAWTLPISSTRWLPSALEESGALPGILMCCYALAQSPDRCKPAHAVEALAVQILGTVLGLGQCRKLFPIPVHVGPSQVEVTSPMALSCLISIASNQFQQPHDLHRSPGSTYLRHSACEALLACLGSERAVAELATQENVLALSKAHQLEQLYSGRNAEDAGCASLRSIVSRVRAQSRQELL